MPTPSADLSANPASTPSPRSVPRTTRRGATASPSRAPPREPATAVAALSRTARLLELLRVQRGRVGLHERASDETLAEARALEPALAAETLSSVLDAYAPGGDRKIGERAAHVAGALRLTGAVPALVRCVDRLPVDDGVVHASLRALSGMRAEATGPLLEMFARCTTAEERRCNAGALVEAGVRDGRVRVALCGMLQESPTDAANWLRAHGDPDAIPALADALDRLALLPSDAPDELLRCDTIIAVVQAIWGLKGGVTDAQRAKFEAAWARSCFLWGLNPEVNLAATR